jgi:hypothetical protein
VKFQHTTHSSCIFIHSAFAHTQEYFGGQGYHGGEVAVNYELARMWALTRLASAPAKFLTMKRAGSFGEFLVTAHTFTAAG